MNDLTNALEEIEAALEMFKRMTEPCVIETDLHKQAEQALAKCQAIRDAVPDDLHLMQKDSLTIPELIDVGIAEKQAAQLLAKIVAKK